MIKFKKAEFMELTILNYSKETIVTIRKTHLYANRIDKF